ncbi:DUF998 domain-containing protein [Kitasatospora sp. NPDC001132]
MQYAVLEHVAAAAWHNSSYDYAVDFISDLGNPVPGDVFQGRIVDSPLHLVMDAAFIAQGALFIAASVLLLSAVNPGRSTRMLLGLAIAHGVGVILLGFFHESSAALHNGVIVVHSIGATAAIIAGNMIPFLVGTRGAAMGAPRWLRAAGAALGILGLAAFVLLQADRPLYNSYGGVPERISVYTILTFELLLRVVLLIRPPRRNALPPAHNTPERLAS